MFRIRSKTVVPTTLALVWMAGFAAAGTLDDVRGLSLPGVAGVSFPRALPESRVAPLYPGAAFSYGGDATVVVMAAVMQDGSVAGVEVVSSDTAGLGFEDAAAEAVSRWRYRPAEKDGLPVDSYTFVKLHFRTPDPAALGSAGRTSYVVPTNSSWTTGIPLGQLGRSSLAAGVDSEPRPAARAGRPPVFAVAGIFPGIGNGQLMDRRGYNPNPRETVQQPGENRNKRNAIKNVRPRTTGGRR